MEVSVWDTYVPRFDGRIMHFDILVPSSLKNIDTIIGFGAEYLQHKAFGTGKISSHECSFCHIQSAPPEVIEAIDKDGYYILEMENCH